MCHGQTPKEQDEVRRDLLEAAAIYSDIRDAMVILSQTLQDALFEMEMAHGRFRQRLAEPADKAGE